MTSFDVYEIYDMRRDRFMGEMLFNSDDDAKAEFSLRYNAWTKDWARRSIDRYCLVKRGKRVDGEYVATEMPLVLMWDVEVRLDFQRFFEADPPHDAASEAEIKASFARLSAEDDARLERRRNAGL